MEVSHCPLLHKLPVEIRLRIYELLLQYSHPIKPRQIIPGSRDLSLLRPSRQIYSEALPVLYDLNTIVVARNDFCRNTDASLKTPLRLDLARHLLVVSLSQSIACTLNGPEGQCDVCRPSAIGLFKMFASMPRLQTVVVHYHKHVAEMNLLRDRLKRESDLVVGPPASTDVRSGSCVYRLDGPAVRHLGIRFQCGRGCV